MRPFTTLTAVAAPLDIPKVDTGMIISARFTRRRRRPGRADYADAFLHDLRFDEREKPKPDFILNQPAYREARILVTAADFGCGSSREGAAYALLDYGVLALIGPGFGDIFCENCMLNGILPVVLPDPTVAALRRQLLAEPGTQLTIELERQIVRGPGGVHHAFDIEATRKHRLLHGLDQVGGTLQLLAEIEAFEDRYSRDMPWDAR